MMSERQIIQIAGARGNQGPDYIDVIGGVTNVYALCNDGTLWCMVHGYTNELQWLQCPDIPQSHFACGKEKDP